MIRAKPGAKPKEFSICLRKPGEAKVGRVNESEPLFNSPLTNRAGTESMHVGVVQFET